MMQDELLTWGSGRGRGGVSVGVEGVFGRGRGGGWVCGRGPGGGGE